MTKDFQTVADRLTIFGIALKKRLASLAGVPDNALRLTDLRKGSSIADFIVLPSVSGKKVRSAMQFVEDLRSAVSKNAEELCALPGGSVEGCNVELADLGFAIPSVQGMHLPKHHAQQQQQNVKQADETDIKIMIFGGCAVAAAGLLLFALYRRYKARSAKTELPSPAELPSPDPSVQTYVTRIQPSDASMAEIYSGEYAVDEKTPVEPIDDKSTECGDIECPSVLDNQSEPGLCGDIETASTPEQGLLGARTQLNSTPEQGMTIVKTMSKRSRRLMQEVMGG